MSLIVAVYAPTGIALSGDSRTTGTFPQQTVDPNDPSKAIILKTSFVVSDAAEKVFLLYERFGVGTFNDALVRNMPIAHYVEQFVVKNPDHTGTTEELAEALLQHFRSLAPIPNVGFVVAGYDGDQQRVFSVDVVDNQVAQQNIEPKTKAPMHGVVRAGDTLVTDRLLAQQPWKPSYEVMNLQDAVDFSRHLIRSTIDQMRFEPRFATVGGPIDTLVVTPRGARFLAHKALVCS